jgi:hypothetical protein
VIRIATAALVLLAALPARAQPGEHVRVEVLTTAPIHVGLGMVAELPARLRLSAAVGYLPGTYVDGISEVVMALDGYDERTADVIRSSLDSSFVGRAHLGWRPLAGAGFYVEAGYGLVALGGGTSEDTLLALALGLELPEDPGNRYDVDSTLHMLDAEIGWEWWIAERLSLRLGVGAAATLDANSSVEPASAPRIPLVTNLFTSLAEAQLDDVLEGYVHTPTVTVAVGWRVF